MNIHMMNPFIMNIHMMNPFNTQAFPCCAARAALLPGQGRGRRGLGVGGAPVVTAANPLGDCKGEAVRVAVQRRQFKALYPWPALPKHEVWIFL